MKKTMVMGSVFAFICGPLLAGGGAGKLLNETPENEIQRTVLMKLNETCDYPESGQDYILPKGFKLKENNSLAFTGTRRPSKALKAFLERNTEDKPWVIECAMAMQIATGFYALKALGKDAFNFYALKGALKKELTWTVPAPAQKFLHQAFLEITSENVQGYISNLLEYEELFWGTLGRYRGINVVTCGPEISGEMTYLGFDPIIFKDSTKTKCQIYEALSTHLCYDPVKKSLKEKQLALRNQLENTPHDFYKMMDDAQQKNPASMVSLAFEISEELKLEIQSSGILTNIMLEPRGIREKPTSTYGDTDIAKETTEFSKFNVLRMLGDRGKLTDDEFLSLVRV